MTHTADDGATFTDEDVLRWADDAEAGFPDSEVVPTEPRAWVVEDEPMVAMTVRVPVSLRESVRRRAQERHMNISQVTRAALLREIHTP